MSDHALLVLDALHSLVATPAVGQLAPAPTPAVIQPEDVFRRLETWQARFTEGNAARTVLAVRADWGQYIQWCEGAQHSPLPASAEQLEAFLANAIARGRKRSTIDRYAYTVSLVHRAAALPDPATDPTWKDRRKVLMRKLRDAKANGTKQAVQLTATGIQQILATLGDSQHGLRDAAMLSLASDSLVRESELVAVKVEHLQQDPEDGEWTLNLPYSKVDQDGVGQDYRYVSRDTIARIHAWQSAAKIESGYLFLPIGGRPKTAPEGDIGRAPHLEAPEVARIFRRRASAAGVFNGTRITGHSTRVGSANDLSREGFSTLEIADAGGWKRERQVLHYTGRSRAGRGAMASLRNRQKKALPPDDSSV